MSMQISRRGSQVTVRQTHETEETLNVTELHAQMEQCRRSEEAYRAKAEEWAAKRLRYQQILYAALGDELNQQDEPEPKEAKAGDSL